MLIMGDVVTDISARPQGVGMGRTPPLWLKDGDIVEVALENVGAITNKVVFDGHTRAQL